VKYAFRWRERAVRQLRAIPQPTALTILQALTPLGDDPRRSDADIKKLAGYSDRYRLRVGDYRIIYEIADTQLIILVVGVGHRREAHRALSLAPVGPSPSRPGRNATKEFSPVSMSRAGWTSAVMNWSIISPASNPHGRHPFRMASQPLEASPRAAVPH